MLPTSQLDDLHRDLDKVAAKQTEAEKDLDRMVAIQAEMQHTIHRLEGQVDTLSKRLLTLVQALKAGS